jgi:hypothetical protein
VFFSGGGRRRLILNPRNLGVRFRFAEREREREREGENFGYPPPLRHWIMVVVRGDIGGEWWLGF